VTTKLSTKGQIVLPLKVRQRLGLQPGDSIEVDVDEGKVVLTPVPRGDLVPELLIDPATGFPVIHYRGATTITSEMVADMLADFP